MRAGILIVGGGPMGAWLALEATRYADPLRDPVVLVDAGDPAAAHGPQVVFGPGLHGGLSPDLAPQLRDGAHALFNFEPQTGRTIGYCRIGAIYSGSTSSDRTSGTSGDLGSPPAKGPGSAPQTEQLAEERRREVMRHGRGLVIETPETARYLPEAALVDPVRCHHEVLALARTRGAITRPGTRVTALIHEAGKVVGVETDRGPIHAETVVLTSTTAARALVPTWTPELIQVPWHQAAHPSPLIQAESGVPFDLPPGGIAELSADPAALDAFFSASGDLESPHPALLEISGALIAPNPLAGTLVLVDREDPTPLATRAPLHGELPPATHTHGVTHKAPDALPYLGEPDPGTALHVALALGPQAAVLAPGLAPGLAAALHNQPVAAYDPQALAPRR